ncbi:hypothetical protein HG430_001320 [Candidatus Gracilibacteria bacterium]|nr:hypothetical protein [Candidatus Gracilibacteria bacterium]
MEDELDWNIVECKGYHYVHLIIEEIMYELAFFDPIRSLQDMKDSSPQYLFEKNFILIPLVNELAVEKIVKSGEYHLLNDKMNI